MRYPNLLLAVIFSVSLSQLTSAADADYRQLGAHLHGAAELNLVVEGKTLVVELITPAANLLGFEHRAVSVADRGKLAEALEVLEAASWLRLTSAAGCELRSSEIESPLLDDHPGERHGKHDKAHRHEDHGDHHSEHGDHHSEHGQEEHDDHQGAHAKVDHGKHHDQQAAHEGAHVHGESDQETHSEFFIAYRYHCLTPEALTGAELDLWQWFEGFERIRGQLIAPGGQQQLELTRDAPRIRF